MRICFFGDSITDMGRGRDSFRPFSLGVGYVFQVTEALLKKDTSIEIINAGISGNRIEDLEGRLEEDVIKYQPDVISILIGVNDVWHRLANGNKVGVSYPTWKIKYQGIINTIKEKLPNTRLILMEPFFLAGAATDPYNGKFDKVYKYARAARKLAKENNLEFIPLQKPLNKLANKIGNDKVLYDGVHPDVLGGRCIADQYLKTFYKKK